MIKPDELDAMKAEHGATTPGKWWAETVNECEMADGPKELEEEIPAKKIHFICCKNYKKETNADSLTVALTRRDRVVIHKQEARLLGTVAYIGDFDEEDKANALFLASAHQNVPKLIAEVAQLRKILRCGVEQINALGGQVKVGSLNSGAERQFLAIYDTFIAEANRALAATPERSPENRAIKK